MRAEEEAVGAKAAEMRAEEEAVGAKAAANGSAAAKATSEGTAATEQHRWGSGCKAHL